MSALWFSRGPTPQHHLKRLFINEILGFFREYPFGPVTPCLKLFIPLRLLFFEGEISSIRTRPCHTSNEGGLQVIKVNIE
jgi:hypothetical protein